MISFIISTIHRIISTICRHICIKYVAAGLEIAVCIQEPMRHRVVVAAHEVIHAGFGIEVIASVSERVQIADMRRACGSNACLVFYGDNIAPSVVFIRRLGLAAAGKVLPMSSA